MKQGIAASTALERYCNIATLEVEDQKFCYDIATIGKDLYRLMELGADEYRICKRVKTINPHFCKMKTAKSSKSGIQLNERNKKGIIYI